MRHRAPHLHSALMTSVSWYQWSGAGRLFRGLGVQWETFLGEKYGLYACLYVILSGFFLPFLVLLSFSACLCSVHQSYHCLKRRLTESFPSHPRRPPCYPITDPSYPGMEGNSGRRGDHISSEVKSTTMRTAMMPMPKGGKTRSRAHPRKV